MWKRAVWQGLVSGTIGAVVMTAGEKVEQRLTGRPDSHVPARVLQRLTGAAERRGRQPVAVNWAMHFGQAALIGVVRSLMAHAGLRGPVASAMFTVVRLTNDQLLENATGVGAPPATWLRPELVVDLLHKAVYGFATGAVADVLAGVLLAPCRPSVVAAVALGGRKIAGSVRSRPPVAVRAPMGRSSGRRGPHDRPFGAFLAISGRCRTNALIMGVRPAFGGAARPKGQARGPAREAGLQGSQRLTGHGSPGGR